MRSIIHTADLHIQSQQYGNSTREADYRRAVEDTIDKVIDRNEAGQETDCAIHGDIFNIVDEKREASVYLARQLMRLPSSCKVYVIKGNHDDNPVSLEHHLRLPNVIDAEMHCARLRLQGQTFRPYGPDGPAVCALGFRPLPQLLQKLKEIRDEEDLEDCEPATELWTHYPIVPAAPEIASPLHVDQLHEMGWKTVIAGDIHNRCLIETDKGTLVSPGSKEVTDHNEHPDKGEWLREPDGQGAQKWTWLPYTKGRPFIRYRTEEELQPQHVAEIRQMCMDAKESTGLDPITVIECPKESRAVAKGGEISATALKVLWKKPKAPKEEQEEIDAPASRGMSLEAELLEIARNNKKLKSRTKEILESALASGSAKA